MITTSSHYYSTNDSTEDAFNDWLDIQLLDMPAHSTKLITFTCYPAITGNLVCGTLYKGAEKWCALYGFTYGINMTIHKSKNDGVWQNASKGFNIDTIVGEGVTDGWYWRKWNSGKAECWKTITVTTAVSYAWGSMYCGNTLMARQNYPFTFSTPPKEIVNVATGSNAVWVFSESGGRGVNTTTTSAIYNVCRPTQITLTANYDLNIYCLGTLA
jgi:hypothetical protein